jgi:hypothetical protein
MDSTETLKTLCNPVGKYMGYSVFEIDFNGKKVKMMSIKDVYSIVGELEASVD